MVAAIKEPRSWNPPGEVDLANDGDCQGWMELFNATREELEQAVAQVGDHPTAVAIWMGAVSALN